MRPTTGHERGIAFFTAALLGVGLCVSSPSTAAQSGRTWERGAVGGSATTGKGLVYEGAAINAPGEVLVYRQGGDHRRVGEITQGLGDAFGVFVDSHGNVYIANVLNGTVTVYAPGSHSPFETLTGTSAPDHVVVGLDGTVYVADMGTTNDQHTNAAVYAYAPGSTTPSRTIATFSNGDFPLGLGLDSANDLYVGVNHPAKGSQPRGEVLEFVSGSGSGKNLGIHVGQGGGLTIDKSNNLLLVDELANAVDLFPPGHRHWSNQITIGGNCCIFDLALNQANDELWVTSGFWGKIYGVTYPGGQLVDTISRHTGWAWGVATSPPGTD